MADRRTLAIEPGGIASDSHLCDVRLQWPAIGQIVAAATHIFMYVGAMNAIVIPRAAFGSAQQAEEFVRPAEQYRDLASAA